MPGLVVVPAVAVAAVSVAVVALGLFGRAADDLRWRRGLLLAPVGNAALGGDRAAAALHQVDLAEDGQVAAVGRMGVLAGVHADGVAGAGLDAQTADDAAQLVDLEDRRALLVSVAGLLGNDGDA